MRAKSILLIALVIVSAYDVSLFTHRQRDKERSRISKREEVVSSSSDFLFASKALKEAMENWHAKCEHCVSKTCRFNRREALR